MFSQITATINYPEDEKEISIGSERMSLHRTLEEIAQLVHRERNATSFVIVFSRKD